MQQMNRTQRLLLIYILIKFMHKYKQIKPVSPFLGRGGGLTAEGAVEAVEAEPTLDLTGILGVDTITEKTGDAGVTVENVKFENGEGLFTLANTTFRISETEFFTGVYYPQLLGSSPSGGDYVVMKGGIVLGKDNAEDVAINMFNQAHTEYVWLGMDVSTGDMVLTAGWGDIKLDFLGAIYSVWARDLGKTANPFGTAYITDFGRSVLPDTNNALDLGATHVVPPLKKEWRDIFSSRYAYLTALGRALDVNNQDLSNMGNVTMATDKMIQLSDETAGPAAAVGNRGKLRLVHGGGGVADVLYMSMKSAGDTYSWVAIATG